MKKLRASFFILMLVTLIKMKVLHFRIAVVAYAQGALRRKQSTASFVEHFRKSYENRICVYFQFS